MVKELKETMCMLGISQSQLAAEVGYSPALISQFFKGEYTGDVKKVEAALRSWLNARMGKTEMFLPDGIFRTDSVQTVNEACFMSYNALKGGISLVYGDAGTGKTTGIRAFSEQYSFAVVITATVCYTAKVLFAELAEKFGESPSGNIHDTYLRVRRKLKGIKKVIIVDEAEHLPYRALDLLRSLQDETGCGLVLAGLERLKHNLKGRKGEYAQLWSRVSVGYKTKLATETEIAGILPSNFSKTAIKSIVQASGNNLRRVNKIADLAKHIAKINESDVTPEIIEKANTLLLS